MHLKQTHTRTRQRQRVKRSIEQNRKQKYIPNFNCYKI